MITTTETGSNICNFLRPALQECKDWGKIKKNIDDLQCVAGYVVTCCFCEQKSNSLLSKYIVHMYDSTLIKRKDGVNKDWSHH